MRYKNGEPLLI